jgi:hypothetical protein
MSLSDEVLGVAQRVMAEHGVNTGIDVEEIKPSGKEVGFEACVEMRTKQVHYKYDPNFKPSKHARKFVKKHNMAKPLENCTRDIISHECRHVDNRKFPACPGGLDNHVKYFYEPIAKVLKPKGKMGATDTVANLVQDLMENTIGCVNQPHSGLSLFYDEVYQKGGWQVPYDAYMRMQVACWANAHDRQLLTPHFRNKSKDPKKQKELKNITDATQQFLYAIGMRGKNHMTQEELVKYFSEKKNWKKTATEFAKAIEPLIDESFEAPSCAFGKRMKEEMKDPSNREKYARGSYEAGEEIPDWMGKEEALDAVYSSMARQIQVKVEEPRKANSLPVVPFNHAPFDPEQDSVSQINFKKPMFIPETETPFGLEALTFGVPHTFYELPLMVKKGITSFPAFKCAYVDCSISMKDGLPGDSGSEKFIPWGDNSKYHYLCKAWYGIIEYLARARILPNVNVSLGTFSDSSRVREGLEEAKKLLFSPRFGGTSMSNQAVDKLLSGGKSVFFTVSDGEIANWSSVKEHFIEKAKEHYYFHIQLGKHTDMSHDLKNAGLSVYTVRSGADLERMAVDLTSRAYKSYVDETLAKIR